MKYAKKELLFSINNSSAGVGVALDLTTTLKTLDT
jgi:hypothetical protein